MFYCCWLLLFLFTFSYSFFYATNFCFMRQYNEVRKRDGDGLIVVIPSFDDELSQSNMLCSNKIDSVYLV